MAVITCIVQASKNPKWATTVLELLLLGIIYAIAPPTAWLRHLLLLCSLCPTFQKDLRNYQGNCSQWQHQKSSNTIHGYQLDSRSP